MVGAFFNKVGEEVLSRIWRTSGHRGLKRVMHEKLKETKISTLIFRLLALFFFFNFDFLEPPFVTATHHKPKDDKRVYPEDPLQSWTQLGVMHCGIKRHAKNGNKWLSW